MASLPSFQELVHRLHESLDPSSILSESARKAFFAREPVDPAEQATTRGIMSSIKTPPRPELGDNRVTTTMTSGSRTTNTNADAAAPRAGIRSQRSSSSQRTSTTMTANSIIMKRGSPDPESRNDGVINAEQEFDETQLVDPSYDAILLRVAQMTSEMQNLKAEFEHMRLENAILMDNLIIAGEEVEEVLARTGSYDRE